MNTRDPKDLKNYRHVDSDTVSGPDTGMPQVKREIVPLPKSDTPAADFDEGAEREKGE